MSITPIYAGLLTIIFVALSFRVIGARRGARVPLGDGGHRPLLRRQRVHANFAEYVPLGLVLMILAELQGAPRLVLHGLGLALLAGRILHAAGVGREPEPPRFRVVGMGLTFAALISGALLNLAAGQISGFPVGK